MTELTLKEIFDKCREKWGLSSQILMLAEECGELVEATHHMLRKAKQGDVLEHFAEEIADVELMIEEIRYYFRDGPLIPKIVKWRHEKLERLKKRLEE